MKIRFQATFEEFEEAVRAVRRGHYRLLAAGAILAGFVTVGYAGYSLFFFDPRSPIGYLVLAAGGFTVFMLTEGQSRLIRRIWYSRPALRETQTVELSDAAIRLTGKDGERSIPWADADGFQETPRLFLVSFRNGALAMIPKRVLGGDPGVEKVRAILSSKIAGSST